LAEAILGHQRTVVIRGELPLPRPDAFVGVAVAQPRRDDARRGRRAELGGGPLRRRAPRDLAAPPRPKATHPSTRGLGAFRNRDQAASASARDDLGMATTVQR